MHTYSILCAVPPTCYAQYRPCAVPPTCCAQYLPCAVPPTYSHNTFLLLKTNTNTGTLQLLRTIPPFYLKPILITDYKQPLITNTNTGTCAAPPAIRTYFPSLCSSSNLLRTIPSLCSSSNLLRTIPSMCSSSNLFAQYHPFT